MNKFFYILLLIFPVLALSQSAPSYYNSINFELEGEEMKDQLSNLITETHDYTVSYSELWDLLKETDLNPDDAEDVLLIYGWNDTNSEDDDDLTRDKDFTCGNGNSCTDETWNREHVFPKALDDSNSDDSGPTADPHMLRSSDVEMNGSRANRMFAAGSGVASYITSNGDFYPGENWRGDVARIIMYMYVRYGEQWNPNYVGQDANSFHADMPDIFLEWNAEDPVSTYEMNRNNIVEDYQGNRNPFIDNPYLATIIWNGPSAENTWPDNLDILNIELSPTIRIYPNPTIDTIYIDGISSKASILIYNVEGKLIDMVEGVSRITLPQKGVYFLQIQDGNSIITQKVIRK